MKTLIACVVWKDYFVIFVIYVQWLAHMSNASAGFVFSDSIDYDFDDNNGEIAQGLTLSDSVEFGDEYADNAEENC